MRVRNEEKKTKSLLKIYSNWKIIRLSDDRESIFISTYIHYVQCNVNLGFNYNYSECNSEREKTLTLIFCYLFIVVVLRINVNIFRHLVTVDNLRYTVY